MNQLSRKIWEKVNSAKWTRWQLHTLSAKKHKKAHLQQTDGHTRFFLKPFLLPDNNPKEYPDTPRPLLKTPKLRSLGKDDIQQKTLRSELSEVSTSSFSLSGPLDRAFSGTQACGKTHHMSQSREGWGLLPIFGSEYRIYIII